MLGYLHQHFSGVADAEVKRVMLAGLEMRFADYDQLPLVFSYILNPHRHMAFLNPECPLVQWRNLVKLVEVLYHRFFPEAKENTGIVDQFIQYLNQRALLMQLKASAEVAFLHAATMQHMTRPGTPPGRLWNMVKREAPELCQLALRLMAMAVNAAGCERVFSQMGLTHTKLRKRLGFAKVTHLAQLRQELHRHREARKKKKMVATASATASASTPTSASTSGSTRDLPDPQDQLMDLDALTCNQ
ncbi:TPA: hypothetical protein ACH3X1_013368 [Trebouxia sp. C0004]